MDENKEINDAKASPSAALLAEDDKPMAPDFETQIAELNDKYLRAVAELENTRRRTAIDAQNTARTRAMAVATTFLPLIDAIDAAQKTSKDDAGIKSMAMASASALTGLGITKIESVGQKLNPQFHNAVSAIESPDTEPGTIIDEVQSGYMFGDTVMRPAMVVVVK